ncbi:MAG: RES family NAD+ phosphorylase [Deltaproteobacteria bacterium]|nr:RES family NAD+ phosphorylase [Deltaproteobacteria bacterium]
MSPGHPEPPPDLATRRLPIRLFSRRWVRVHRLAHAPLHFGATGDNRFDAPAAEFGVLYVGADIECAFIETFGHATGIRLLDRRELPLRGLARISATRRLRLVDLRSDGLARIGADSALTAGLDYDLAHRWAKALHDHPRAPDGIAYRARHDPARTSAAIFDRARVVLRVRRLGSIDADPTRLAGLLDRYDFGLI